MVCVFCGSKLGVVNSRPQKKMNQVWRRRQCPRCSALFTSVEMLDLSKSLRVERATKHLEPFQREFLFTSIYEACKHRKTAAEDAMALTDTVICRLLRKKSGAIVTRDQLCILTTEVLRRFDKAAATSYQAFHPLLAHSK